MDGAQRPATKIATLHIPLGFSRVRTFLRFGKVRIAVVVQLRLADREMRVLRMVQGTGELAAQPDGADIRSILIADPVSVKSSIRNRKRELTRLCISIAHHKTVLTENGFGLKPDILDNQSLSHIPSEIYTAKTLLSRYSAVIPTQVCSPRVGRFP